MATIAELLVKIGLDDSELKSGEKSINSSLGAIGGKIAQLGVSVKTFQAILSGIEFNKVKQQAEIAFTTMLGSATLAKTAMTELRDLSVKTPLEFKDVRAAGQTLLQFGVSAENVTNTVRMLGDVALGDANKLQSLSIAFGQVQSAGKLTGQDLLQFINAGFNPLNEIAKKTGESMEVLRDRMSKGGISAKEVTEAFKSATSAGGQFDNAMAKMSNSLAGAESNFKDAFDTFLGRSTEGITKPLTEGFTKFAQILQDLGPNADNLSRSLGTVVQIAVKIGEVIGWVAKQLDLTVVAGAAIGLAFGPWGALIGAAAGAALSLYNHIVDATDQGIKFTGATMDANAQIAASRKAMAGMTTEQIKLNKATYEGLLAHTASAQARERYEREIIAINQELGDRKKKQDAEEKERTAEEKKATEERAKFEMEWMDKSGQHKVETLDAQYQAAIEAANKIGADTQAIEEWYAEERKKLSEQEAEEKKNLWDNLIDGLKQKYKSWGDTIQTISSIASGFLKDSLAAIGKGLVEGKMDWKGWGQTALQALAGVLEAIGAQLAGLAAVHALALDWVGSGIAAAGSVAAYVAAGAVKQWGSSLSSYASGTDYARGGLALVGEQGPELVQMPQGAKVFNAAETRNMGSGQYNFTFNSPKALDAGEQARFMRSSMRQLAAEGVI